MTKSPAHVAVETRGLRVFFEQNVGSVQASALASPLELGHATAVVAALDGSDKNIQVKENGTGGATVETTPSTTAPPTVTRPSQQDGGTSTAPTQKPGSTNSKPQPGGGKGTTSTGTPSVSTPTPPSAPAGESVVAPPADPGSPTTVTDHAGGAGQS